MDRDCRLRSRAELDHILDNHKLWRKKNACSESKETLCANSALHDPLRADLSGARLPLAYLIDADLVDADLSGTDLSGGDLAFANLTGASFDYADLTGASFDSAKLAGANLSHALLSGADLRYASLISANLQSADLTGANLENAILTDADLSQALTGANPAPTDLSRAVLTNAHLAGASLADAELLGAKLSHALLTGADLSDANLTNANLYGADLSNSILQETDFTNAELTRASLSFADFEPKVPPTINTIARTSGLQTLLWSGPTDEVEYLLEIERAQQSKTGIEKLSLSDRWLVWLFCDRGRSNNKPDSWHDAAEFLWSDIFGNFQHEANNCATAAEDKLLLNDKTQGSSKKGSDREPSSEQAQYQVMDVRTALSAAGYSEPELQVNLAYQRHTQSSLGMILFDWTCEYGAAPIRPLVIALLLALIAIPIYWLGIRKKWLGSQLLLIEDRGQEEVKTLVDDPLKRPNWRGPLESVRPAERNSLRQIATRLHLQDPSRWLNRFIWWPRLCWEGKFLKEVVLFSLISVVNLGFDGLDFGSWIRSLLFHKYDLEARGWLRTAAGIQSLLGLCLLALSLLSFFGHRFE
jgi:uncharacterized protein YjbI with pentapeptide repeats